jgi:glycosyltransferase involved in cell wall biosynthesis
MPGKPDVSVIIATRDRVERLEAALAALWAQTLEPDRFEIVVVDDGSTDETAAVARARGAEVVSFGENRGLKAAIAAGWGWALERGYKVVGRVDADGQHPVSELSRLLDDVQSGRCDVAVGSRFVGGEGYPAYRYEQSPARRFGTALLRRAMAIRLGRRFGDAMSGMVAADAKALPLLAEPYESGAPEVEALMRLHEAGLVVCEVPVDMRERSGGTSKLRGKKAILLVLTVIGSLLAVRRWRKR